MLFSGTTTPIPTNSTRFRDTAIPYRYCTYDKPSCRHIKDGLPNNNQHTRTRATLFALLKTLGPIIATDAAQLLCHPQTASRNYLRPNTHRRPPENLLLPAILPTRTLFQRNTLPVSTKFGHNRMQTFLQLCHIICSRTNKHCSNVFAIPKPPASLYSHLSK